MYLHILLIINIVYSQSSNQLDATQLDNSQQPIIYREYGVKHLPLENGVIALWPSVLLHNTEPNETDHERISASFNIKFRT